MPMEAIDIALAMNNVPSAMAPYYRAMYQQESSGGRASRNGMQMTHATARNPGFGIKPYPEADLNDPIQSTIDAVHYSLNRARASGLDPSKPTDIPQIVRQFNGGGDPHYFEHVAARLGSQVPLAPSRPLPSQEHSVPNPYRDTPLKYTPRAPSKELEKSGGQYTGHPWGNTSQMLAALASGFAGKGTFGQGISAAFGNLAGLDSQAQDRAMSLQKMKQRDALTEFQSEMNNQRNDLQYNKLDAQNYRTDTQAATADQRNALARLRLGQMGQLGNARLDVQRQRMIQNAMMNGTEAPRFEGGQNGGSEPPSISPPSPGPFGDAGGAAQTPRQADGPPQTPLPAPPAASQGLQISPQPPPANGVTSPGMDPWHIPETFVSRQRGVAAQNAARSQAQRENSKALGDLSNDLTKIQRNSMDWRSISKSLNNLNGPGHLGTGGLSGYMLELGNKFSPNGVADLDKLGKDAGALTLSSLPTNGRILNAEIFAAQAQVPNAHTSAEAGRRIIAERLAQNHRLEKLVQARLRLMRSNPGATLTTDIDPLIDQYAQAYPSAYTEDAKGHVTEVEMPDYDDWVRSGRKSAASRPSAPGAAKEHAPFNIPKAAIEMFLTDKDPHAEEYFEKHFGKGSAAWVRKNAPQQ